MARSICDRVRGQFLPISELPTADDESPRGDEPIAGRFWVRDCRASVEGGRLELTLGGVGWAWVERSSWGFGLENYVYFAVAGSTIGDVDVGFEPRQGLAMIQFRPVALASVSGGALGTVETRTNVGGAILNIVSIGSLGAYADGKARRAIDEKVRTAFAGRLGAGFFVTYDIARQQVDSFGAGGPPPMRPFADGTRWLANERQVLRDAPGGVHVLGPFAATPAAAIDYRVLSGAIRYRAECVHDVARWFDGVAQGRATALPPPTHSQAGLIRQGESVVSISVPCPFYLLHEASTPSVVVDVRVRADVSGYPNPGH